MHDGTDGTAPALFAGDGWDIEREAEVLVEALKACGSGVRFTVYEGAEHEDTWRRAYADPALFEWMASQRLP